MSDSIYDLADKALPALRKTPIPRLGEKVRVVSEHCEICGRTHRMGLRAPRCARLILMAVWSPLRGRAIAMALLAGCLALSGCARSHFYVSGVNVGVQATSDGKEITAGLQFAPNPYAYKSVVPLYSK